MTGDATILLVPVTPDELGDVESIFDDLSGYSLNVDGVPRRHNAAYDFATALPAGQDLRHKHSFVARRDGLPVGLLDILNDYPASGTAFIGLLAIRENAQGRGVGRALFQEAERFARDVLKVTTLRLAVVEANPVAGFWKKMGFLPTGEIKLYEGEAVTSRAVLMEKQIQAPAPPMAASST